MEPLQGWHLPLLDDPAFLPLQPLLQRTLLLAVPERLITALAGLLTAALPYLGPHAGPFRDGLKALQVAFREASAFPDEPGEGPGEKQTGPVR